VPAAVVVAADREDRVTDRDQHLAGDVGAVETERAETGEDLLALDVVVLGWGVWCSRHGRTSCLWQVVRQGLGSVFYTHRPGPLRLSGSS